MCRTCVKVPSALPSLPGGGDCTDWGVSHMQARQVAVQEQMHAVEADVKAQQERTKQLQADLNSHAALRLSVQQAEQVQMHAL